MATKKRRILFYNFIWAIILAVLLALPSLGVMELSTLALEQETRCGQQEHNHTGECYFRDMLVCDQKAHNHSENCYLVLLSDNDINWLLSTIENTEEKSLEDVIDSAMVQALNLNPNLTSVNSQQIHLAADHVRQLNDVIAENHIEPAVVLNENIRDNYLAYTPPQPEPEEEEIIPAEETVSQTETTSVPENSWPAQPDIPDVTRATEPPETTVETEPPETTVETEPPETTVETEPPETTVETEPPETTVETEPPETTVETEPPETTVETEPPETTVETEPPETTVATEPPETTVATEPPETTVATEPPETTVETESPETTEETEPPETTVETEPPETTVETEPPETTVETEPPETTVETEPPETTVETEPPETTVATEPPETTVATEPPETTVETEPPETTVETEPPETTVETEPSETTEETILSDPGFLWETGKKIPHLPEEPAGTGEAALYLYHGDYWVCIDVLTMDPEEFSGEIRYSISAETVRKAYEERLLLDADTNLEQILYNAPQSPAEGIENITVSGEGSVCFGRDPGHFYLTIPTTGPENQLLYEPARFHQVVLNGTAAEDSLGSTQYYVQSGRALSDVCSEAFLWQNAAGETITGTEPVTADMVLYAGTKPEEMETVSAEEAEPVFPDTLLQAPAEGSGLMFAAQPAGEMILAAGNDGVALAAVGGSPSYAERTINFYIRLDGQPVFVNNRSLTRPWWGGRYCTINTAVDAYTSENAIITGLTTKNLGSSYSLYFNTTGNFDRNHTAATTNGNNIAFSSSDDAQFAILSYGNGNTYSPVDFFTVKLDRSAVAGTDQLQYVEKGMDSTFALSEEYLWYLDETGTIMASEEDLENIDSTTILYAKYKNRTVTFETNGGSPLEPVTVSYGSTLPRPEDPVRDGLVLEGWYTDGALTELFDFNTPVTEDMKLYAKWAQRCTVSFLDADGSPILEDQYIGAGMELTLPEYYFWIGTDGQIHPGGTAVIITEDTVFTGSIYTYTLTFHSDGTIYAVQEKIAHGSGAELPADPQLSGHRFMGWYTDETYSQPFYRDVPIVSNMDLYARWGFDVTLNYLDLQGNLKKHDTLSHTSGETITLPEHYTWTNPGSDPEDPGDDTVYNGGDTITVLHAMTLIGNPERYTVSYVDQEGNAAAEAVALEYGSSFFFPQPPIGCVWEGSDGSHYIGGDYYDAVESDLTFTAVETSVTIHYNVNFPAGAVNLVDQVPTLYATTSATASDTIPGGTSATIRSLTSNTARREVSSSNKESNTYYFKGWKVEGTDTLLPADTVLTWSALAQYADSQGNIRLTGAWEDGSRINSVTFFVQFDSVAMDTDGNITSRPIEDFTHEIFNTYLGGLPTTDTNQLRQFEIADTTADNSFTADQKIRALYGERSEGIWMYEFPHDDDVFAYLKEYLQNNPARSLTVDGEKVLASELDARHYAIRWYVFKLEGSSWHVDGKLVRREGLLNVYKYFQGEEAAITQAESGFYILAENGTRNAEGSFVPYAASHSHFKQYILTIDDATIDTLRRSYPNADFAKVTQGDAAAHTYYWSIRGVLLDELWRVTEFPKSNISGFSHYAEYSIYDSDGELTAIAEYGTQASVVGKTFALDEDPDQGMTVEFTNYYYDNHSILLKKEDAATGAGIAGAGFNFIQKDNVLSFEAASGESYIQNPNVGNTDIVTGANGYVTIEGFSYQYGADSNQGDRGRILIQESIVPEGYGWAATVELGLDSSDNVYIARVTTVDGEEVPRDQWSKYVELPRNDVLIVKNHVTELISVTARKIWNTNVPADSVQVVLQANGQNAANIFPGLKNAQVKLSAANNWSCTWEDLPRYAGGQPVTWGIKEVLVGNAPTLSDGVSFANWIPVYSNGAGTDYDGDGDVDNWYYTVTNYSKTPKLIVSKVGIADEGLPGAVFTLEQVELGSEGWQRVSGTAPISQTTDAHGMLTFENLVGTYTYRLTEVKAPEQHIILIDPLVFTVDGDGNIQKLDDTGAPVPITSQFLRHDSAYHLTVKNLICVELPETGGPGTAVYWLCGMALMLTALLLYKLPMRKEDCISS